MPIDDALHDGQTHTRAREFGRRMKPLKNSEQLAHIRHIEAHPVVPDVNRRCIHVGATEFDACIGGFSGEFPSISEKVIDNETQKPFIALGGDLRGNREFYGSTRDNFNKSSINLSICIPASHVRRK